jgi:Icc-related predicted phosphoesterase
MPNTVRLAAVGDLHCKRASEGALRELFAAASARADVLLLCGDLTDYGAPEEAEVLAGELRAGARIPVVAVLGNHDFEGGKQEEVKAIVSHTGATVLDGGSCELCGIGFAGAKGFGGGFGDRMLGPWGEEAIKLFVREAVDEALKLETALRRLETPSRVVLLHYAPVEGTVVGEPPVIYPFLGSSRLEEPLTHYPVQVVFHGHAHHGSLEGRTQTGVPVFNVCMPLLRDAFPDRPPFRVVDLPLVPEG